MRRCNFLPHSRLAFWWTAFPILCSCATLNAQHANGIPDRWLLVYAGSTSRTRYTESDFATLLGRGSGCREPLLTGIVFLSLQWRGSGRSFTSWLSPALRGAVATGQDWQEYRDSLVEPGGFFQRLDAAINSSYPGSRIGVAVMLPYLGASMPKLSVDGRTYTSTDSVSRREFYERWLNGISEQSRKRDLQHVTFVGGYWLNEGLLPGDSATIRSVSEAAHANSLRLLWIPSYRARGAAAWRELGFTDAWYQPNFFFDPQIGSSRMDSAADFASAHGMGLELEFDRRLLTQAGFASRLAPYLTEVERHPPKSVAIYDGAGGLIDLLTSTEPAARAAAKRLIAILCPNGSVI